MKRNRSSFANLLIAVVLFAGFAGCIKQPSYRVTTDEPAADPGIYISTYDTAADPTAYQTFGIADSLAIIQDNELFGRELTPFDTIVLNTIARRMQKKGYRLVDTSGHPDLAINVSRIYSDYTGVFSYASYWVDYNSYYDPRYWGCPLYGYSSRYHTAIYAIENGALSIDLLDLKNAKTNGKKIRSVWSGLARGKHVFNPTNAKRETEALLDQSQFVKKGITNSVEDLSGN